MVEAFSMALHFNMEVFRVAIKLADRLGMDQQQQRNVLISSKDSMVEAFNTELHFNIKARMAEFQAAIKSEDR